MTDSSIGSNKGLQIHHAFPTRMNLQSLAPDIVEELVSYLPSPDALRLSMTAHGFRSIAKRRALAEVRLRSTERATVFCKYMLTDIPDRLRWLRQLEIHLGTFYEERISLAIPGLVRVLAHAPALRSLTFDDAEVMLESGILAAAVRMLTTLEELNLRKYGLLSVSTVRRLSSNLRKLGLTSMLLPRRDVVLNMLLCPAPEDLTDDDQADERWKSIEELELDVACPADSIRTIPHEEIVQSFPNLRRLHFTVTEAPEEEDVRMRPAGRAGWPHLDRLTGTPASLGGFNGPVKCLWFTQETPENLLEQGIAVVRHLDPVMLSVTIHPLPDTRFWNQLAENSNRLRYLRIELANAGKEVVELDEWRAHVPAALGRLVDIVCATVVITDVQSGALFLPIGDVIAQELATHVHSLRYVCIQAGSIPEEEEEWYGKVNWWRVAGSAKQRRVERVTTGLGAYVEKYLTSDKFERTLSLDDRRLFPDA
ncbi:hypothetical protein DAEQUDRAFT_815668 [Daedalea quercina L-15889]|uniref:F-box domain-containing protein n=1 Tax=Daedalea quercina L-15889 TaxID=1314783 RepID=A0A165KPT3_9APHY|nr:hypothetical protein DAEQUDRAFT_815668 [Daedalea quercina L-15889]